ncbi:MAG TPA: FAD/NAD(P)-binding protein [Caulifigura sp.]|jgi:uncharacterized NAD(P)/FAD-binding protein YdhS|nr:FAD/NAD(P)-binding protein [Caulifigura sp.]
MRSIAIIGGGFSGTMTAVNLARLSDIPLRVLLINSGQPLARGTAYGTRRGEHLLNVAARNMSAFPDLRNHLVEWLQSRSEYCETPEAQLREAFIPRKVYGDYLRGLLLDAMHLGGRSNVRIELVEGEAADLRSELSTTFSLVMANGAEHSVNQVLLATGNPPPAPVPGQAPGFAHPAYRANPWSDWECSLPPSDQPVVLLGTGLTMVDVFLTLRARGWTGPITAISRNGLLPQPHFKGVEYTNFMADQPKALSLAEVRELVEMHCRTLRRQGQNPAIAVDRLRPYTQRLWQALTIVERREFLRHDSARWNAARHRIAAPVHEQLSDAVDRGQLRVLGGAITGLSADGALVHVHVRDSQGVDSEITGALVVNCTGPQASFSKSSSPLLQSLLQRGIIRSDALDMGLEINDDFAAVDSEGHVSNRLFAIGPLLKGSLWETTAVPELRGQALRAAQILLDIAPVAAMPGEEVLEYCI